MGFLGTIDYYHVEILSTSKATLFAALTTLMASPSVLAAQPDFVGDVLRSPNDPGYYSSPRVMPLRLIGLPLIPVTGA